MQSKELHMSELRGRQMGKQQDMRLSSKPCSSLDFPMSSERGRSKVWLMIRPK